MNALACIAFLCASCTGMAHIEIAKRGVEPAYSIVVRRNATENERNAAKEFANGVRQLTGANLATVVGKAPSKGVYLNAADVPEELGEDGFTLKVKDGDVFVTGGRRGVIYGVHELLETYGGILWLAPDFTHVPTNGVFSVPVDLNVCQKPALGSRNLTAFDSWALTEFATKLRLNETTIDEKLGGSARSFDDVLSRCHTFQKLVPPSKYFNAHPEYFSLVNGNRTKDHAQLCLTNPDVFDIALSNVLARIAANKSHSDPKRRSIRYYGVSQDDWNGYCRCDRCAAIDAREESHAGCVIWFVNKIAEAVEKVHPDVMISTLAYMYSRKPPKFLKPRHNVEICLCSIECDFSRPMLENRYKENIAFREDVRKWGAVSKEMYIWDYAANYRATASPYPNISAMCKNIRFYRNAGVTGLFEEGFRKNPAANFTDLKGWVGAKLMWNPDQSTAALIRCFCEAYYGKAAPMVLEYIRLMESQDSDERKSPLTYAVMVEKLPFDTHFYEQAAELMQKAEVAVVGCDEKIREHVAWLKFGIDYSRAALYAQHQGWRILNVSRSLADRLDRSEFERMRSCARSVVKRLDDYPNASVSSYLNDFRLKGYVRALAAAEFPAKNPVVAMLQDWAFTYSDHPKSKTILRVEDCDATDGKAISISNDGEGWKVTCATKTVWALDAGTRYRLRARMKVMPKKGAKPDKWLVEMGLHDSIDKKMLCGTNVPACRATGRYEWYDVGEWTDEGHACALFINPRDSVLSFDCMEVSKALPEAGK